MGISMVLVDFGRHRGHWPYLVACVRQQIKAVTVIKNHCHSVVFETQPLTDFRDCCIINLVNKKKEIGVENRNL